MAVINKNEFTKYVYNLLDGQNYNIGLHGVSKTRSNDITGKTDSDTCEDILNDGLTIYSGRSINGTVYSCGRIDSEDDIKNVNDNLKGYIYNDSDYYVVVAIPTVVTNSMGESIYIGKTNLDNRFKNKMDSTGYEISSIADTAILTDISLSGSKVPSEFILGYYKRLPDGNVDFVDGSCVKQHHHRRNTFCRHVGDQTTRNTETGQLLTDTELVLAAVHILCNRGIDR